MRRSLITLIAPLIVLSLLAGCGQNEKTKEMRKNEFKAATTKEFYLEKGASVDIYKGFYPSIYQIVDYDKDGTADFIWSIHHVLRYAEGHDVPKGLKVEGITRVMTPEIREVATRVLQAEHELSRLIAEQDYRLEYGESKFNSQ